MSEQFIVAGDDYKNWLKKVKLPRSVQLKAAISVNKELLHSMRQQHVGPLPCANNTAWLKKIFFIPHTAFVPLPLVNLIKHRCIVIESGSVVVFIK